MTAGARPTPRKAPPDAAKLHVTRKVIEALLLAYPGQVSRSNLLAKIKNVGTSVDLENSLASLGDELYASVSRLGGGRPMHLYGLTEAAVDRLNRPDKRPSGDGGRR